MVVFDSLIVIDLFSSGLDIFVKLLNNDDLKILKKESPASWKLLNKKLAYPYEYFNKLYMKIHYISIYEDYDIVISILTKEYYFSKLKTNTLMMKNSTN